MFFELLFAKGFKVEMSILFWLPFYEDGGLSEVSLNARIVKLVYLSPCYLLKIYFYIPLGNT